MEHPNADCLNVVPKGHPSFWHSHFLMQESSSSKYVDNPWFIDRDLKLWVATKGKDNARPASLAKNIGTVCNVTIQFTQKYVTTTSPASVFYVPVHDVGKPPTEEPGTWFALGYDHFALKTFRGKHLLKSPDVFVKTGIRKAVGGTYVLRLLTDLLVRRGLESGCHTVVS